MLLNRLQQRFITGLDTPDHKTKANLFYDRSFRKVSLLWLVKAHSTKCHYWHGLSMLLQLALEYIWHFMWIFMPQTGSQKHKLEGFKSKWFKKP